MITDDPTGDTLSSPDNQPTTPASDNSLSASDTTPQGSETRQLADNRDSRRLLDLTRDAIIAALFNEAYTDYMNSRGPKSLAWRVAKLLGVADSGRVDSALQALLNAPRERRDTLFGQITLLVDFFASPTAAAVDPFATDLGESFKVFDGELSARQRAAVGELSAMLTSLRRRVEGRPIEDILKCTMHALEWAIPNRPASADFVSWIDAELAASEMWENLKPTHLAEWLVRRVDVWETLPPAGMQFDVRQFFADPDVVGTTAYRAVFDMLEELADCAGSQNEPFTKAGVLGELGELEDVITSMRARLSSGLSEPALNFGSSSPDDLRAAGWLVQLHQDHAEDKSTSWTLVNAESLILEGEGQTDAEALDCIRRALLNGYRFTVTTPDGIREHYRGTNVGDVALKVLRNEGGDVTPGWFVTGLPQAPGFKIGDNVIVSPKAGHPAFEFAGTIVGRRPTGDWIVEDQAGDAFDCGADQMRHETETD